MRLVHLTVLLAITAACSSSTEPGQQTQPAVLTALPRALTAPEQKLVAANNDFAFSLFRQLNVASAKDSNVFASPLSASMSLGMAMTGASSSTYSQMRATLGFGTLSETEVSDSYKSMISLLRGLDASVDFRIANSVWFRNTFTFNQSFLDATKNAFDAQVSALDFNNPSAKTTINDWVNTATNAKIPSIIDKISSDNVMFLINAIYFKGDWRDRFKATETADGTFHAVSGDQTARFMHRNVSTPYRATADYEAADLLYGSSAFSMTVVLPRAGKSIDAVAASLESGTWASTTSGMSGVLVDLSFPRVKLTWERKLNDDLIALGMRDAFSDGIADFTRMSPAGHQLVISEVKQKTFVDINEDGTEAAAVTSTGISVTSAPLTVTMKVDRPYLIVMRERYSGTILFMGKIVRMP